jgi:hypothetical protein
MLDLSVAQRLTDAGIISEDVLAQRREQTQGWFAENRPTQYQMMEWGRHEVAIEQQARKMLGDKFTPPPP